MCIIRTGICRQKKKSDRNVLRIKTGETDMKKGIMVYFTVLLICSLCACGNKNADISESTGSGKAGVAATYGKSADTSELETSKSAGSATATPEATKAPKATESPAVTESPAATEVPKTTEAPAVTATPAATKEPKATEAPKATESPKATATPKATEEPKATETPKTTEAPAATENKAVNISTPTPEPTAKPTEAPHTHTYVDTVVSEATCESGRVVESVCSVCGASGGTRTDGAALGHDMYEDWFNYPSCTNSGWVTDRCRRCDYADSHAGNPLGHDWEETSTTGGNCITSGHTEQHCRRCGFTGDSWENGQYGPCLSIETWTVEEHWDEVDGQIVYFPAHSTTACTDCGKEY